MSNPKKYKEKPPTTTWYRLKRNRIEVVDVIRETKSQVVVLEKSYSGDSWFESRYAKQGYSGTFYANRDEAVKQLRERLTKDIAEAEESLARNRETLAKLNAKFPIKE